MNRLPHLTALAACLWFLAMLGLPPAPFFALFTILAIVAFFNLIDRAPTGPQLAAILTASTALVAITLAGWIT